MWGNIFTVCGCSHFLAFYTHSHLFEGCLKWMFSSIYVTSQLRGNDITVSCRILAMSKLWIINSIFSDTVIFFLMGFDYQSLHYFTHWGCVLKPELCSCALKTISQRKTNKLPSVEKNWNDGIRTVLTWLALFHNCLFKCWKHFPFSPTFCLQCEKQYIVSLLVFGKVFLLCPHSFCLHWPLLTLLAVVSHMICQWWHKLPIRWCY